MKVARIYLRVSTVEQDLTRQADIEHSTRAAGYYIAGVYREKASGARADRPELLRMISDLQPEEVVVAERIDRISRLPLVEAEQLVASIRAKGARLAIPGVVDLTELAADADGVTKIVLEAVQELLLKLALQMARDDYETRRERQRQGVQLAKSAGKYLGRQADISTHDRIIALRSANHTIKRTAELAGCSESQVKRIWALHRNTNKPGQIHNMDNYNNRCTICGASGVKKACDLCIAKYGSQYDLATPDGRFRAKKETKRLLGGRFRNGL